MERAAGLIVFRQLSGIFECLLLQASYGNHEWSVPKGHVEQNEEDMEAALRETCEEAGLKKNQLTIMTDFRRELKYEVRGRKQKTVVYWLAQLINPASPVILSEEHKAFKWLTIDEACQHAKFDDLIALLKESHSYISK